MNTILPHDVQAERDLLAILDRDPRYFEAAARWLWPDDFFLSMHVRAFESFGRDFFHVSAPHDETAALVASLAERIRSAAIVRERAVVERARDWSLEK